MIYIRLEDGIAVEAKTHLDQSDDRMLWLTRHNFTDMAHAQSLALQLTAATGKHYVATDAGQYTSPRFDVIHVPMVGDLVSMAFNGDSYPCGKILSISKTLKKITTEGGDFYRVRNSGCWRKDKTWSLIPGVHNDRNPHI